jgi:hypothetical protein
MGGISTLRLGRERRMSESSPYVDLGDVVAASCGWRKKRWFSSEIRREQIYAWFGEGGMGAMSSLEMYCSSTPCKKEIYYEGSLPRVPHIGDLTISPNPFRLRNHAYSACHRTRHPDRRPHENT